MRGWREAVDRVGGKGERVEGGSRQSGGGRVRGWREAVDRVGGEG